MSDKISEEDFQKILKVYDAQKDKLEIITEAYRIKSPIVLLDTGYKIFFMTLLAERKAGYRLPESKLCGLTTPKRRLDEILNSAREKGETRIDYIPELIIPTRDHLFLHLEPDITLVEQGAVVLIKKAFKKNPKSILTKLFPNYNEKDIYIEAGNTIDLNDPESKKKTMEIHVAYIDSYVNDKSRKVIVDLSGTEKISEDCMKAFSCWAKMMENFYLAYPCREIYNILKAKEIGFPEQHIILDENKKNLEEIIPAPI